MKNIFLISLFFFLFGCATAPDEDLTASELYQEATELNNRADYIGADEKFRELEATFPTSPYAKQAILDQIYSYLKRRKYVLAVDAADRFMILYPDHPQVPYALYMKGVTFFRENRGILDLIGRQDPALRDTKLMRLAYESLQELLNRYPESPYSEDAAERLRYLINNLARSEFYIGQYYYKREAYSAAINHAEKVLLIYPDSNVLELALDLLLNSYQAIGADREVAQVKRILEYNFPESEFLE